MPNIVIENVPVEFPHENVYAEQRKYMETVIRAIQNKVNCVLESPTGTGKTLSLICSSLAVIHKHKVDSLNARTANEANANPSTPETPFTSKIIYTSRTHSQLKQCMSSLRSTKYKNMHSAALASRGRMCCNPDVAKQRYENIDGMCRSKVKQGSCLFFDNYELKKCEIEKEISGQVLDIEDLVVLGTQKEICPYYMSHHMAQRADVIFSPYNYVLDERTRGKTISDCFSEGIIIFDEAHNIPQMCEDIASVEFTDNDIFSALRDVDYVSRLLLQQISALVEDSELDDLRIFIRRFKRTIDEIVILNPLCGVKFDGDYIFTVMDKCKIEYQTSVKILLLIDKIFTYLADANRLSQCGAGLRKFKEILWVPFFDSGEEFRKNVKTHYRVYAEMRRDDQNEVIVPHVKVYNFWCFSAKFVLEKLLKILRTRSIIFTSGTMTPLDSFIQSLGIPIGYELQNNHIVPKSHVLVEIISSAPNGEVLDSSFRNRSRPKYIDSLGQAILSLCRIIPDGMLIFFTCYKQLNKCIRDWQASGIWNLIEQDKPIFIEPQLKEEFLETMEDYYANIHDPRTKGAIFIGVCRGKVAEGLDFIDANGRAVMITGIPFPPWAEPKVQIKMKYMDDHGVGLSGNDWYSLEALRAVNQAVGRIIRHRNDFGAILLGDCRFNEPKQKRLLSAWIRNHFNQSNLCKGFGQVISSVNQFFRRHQTLPNAQAFEANEPDEMDVEPDEVVFDKPMTAIEYNLLFENAM